MMRSSRWHVVSILPWLSFSTARKASVNTRNGWKSRNFWTPNPSQHKNSRTLPEKGTPCLTYTIPNNIDGFKQLLQTIRDCTKKPDKIKAGLEAAGHYSYNILGFLLDNDLPVYVMNPLYTKTESTSSSGTNVESILWKRCYNLPNFLAVRFTTICGKLVILQSIKW